jgi:UDP-GlcNAc:undecaprenyl-phosphate/decaprenyl-phosphate GlcNAc-1-phosphate transferase
LSPLLSALLAAVVTALATPVAVRLAVRTGVVDHPGPLKPHDRPVPYLGGAAVFCGLAAVTIGSAHRTVLLPLGLALALGLIDDVVRLPAVLRLIAELGIGATVAWVMGPCTPTAGAGVAVTTVLLINAVNMVDGIDGLAAGTCAVTGLGAALLGPAQWASFAAAVAGAAAGFYLFNRSPARIYLGDAGSYLLGTAVAVLGAAYWSATGDVSEILVLVALGGYLWVELASTIGRRLLTRRPLFGGDRDHVYDRLERAGIAKTGVTAMLVAGQAVVTAGAVVGYRLDSRALVLAVVLLLAGAAVAAVLSSPSRPS